MTRKVYLKQFTDIVGAMKDFGEAWGYTKDRFINHMRRAARPHVGVRCRTA